MELWKNKTRVLPENKQQVRRSHHVPTETQRKIYGITYRFQEEDVADGSSFEPSDSSRSTRQFLSSERKQSILNAGAKEYQHDQRGRPYHKTIPITFAPRLLQIGDDQGPHTDDVGYNIQTMRHTQVVGQDGLFQSGARKHPITSLSTFRPIDDEFGHGEPVPTIEHTGSCPL